MLFPGQEVELPENAEIVKTYEGLGYITTIEDESQNNKKVKGGTKMPANYLHGVETIEVLKGPVPVREVKSAVVFLVGTAPVHLTRPAGVSENDWYAQTINNPILILRREDAAYYFGEPSPWLYNALCL